MKLRCIEKYFANVTYGKVYDVVRQNKSYTWIINDKGQEQQFDTIELYFEESIIDEAPSHYNNDKGSLYKFAEDHAPSHYNNDKGSLYKFAEDHGLNAYEFDLVKRIIRCRKKGNFVQDLEKTKFLIDLYIKEWKQ